MRCLNCSRSARSSASPCSRRNASAGVAPELELDDLGGGGRWCATWTLPSIGLAVGDIVDTRIVLVDGVPTVGRSAVLHPREAHEAIEKIVARARGAGMPPRDLVDHLDKMRLKLDRYSNVRIRHVYQYPDDAIM